MKTNIMSDIKKDDFRTLINEDLYRELCKFYDNQISDEGYQVRSKSLKELHQVGLIKIREKSVYENGPNFEVTSFGKFVVLFY
jgi:hypothetical protein